MKKSIVLLSGGLDSAVSLAAKNAENNKILCLFFDYGQKSMEFEKNAAKNLAEYYKTDFKIIKLDWLKEITKSALVNPDNSVPDADTYDMDDDAINKNLWIPNRNGLFVNIAACYADSFNYDEIIIGANEEEAKSFKDNSQNFIDSVENSLKFSANGNIKVISPLIKMNKSDIIILGKKLNLPFSLIRSCYNNTRYHCGKCESCVRLLKALKEINDEEIKKELFVKE